MDPRVCRHTYSRWMNFNFSPPLLNIKTKRENDSAIAPLRRCSSDVTPVWNEKGQLANNSSSKSGHVEQATVGPATQTRGRNRLRWTSVRQRRRLPVCGSARHYSLLSTSGPASAPPRSASSRPSIFRLTRFRRLWFERAHETSEPLLLKTRLDKSERRSSRNTVLIHM